jgi:hypothetical protein
MKAMAKTNTALRAERKHLLVMLTLIVAAVITSSWVA